MPRPRPRPRPPLPRPPAARSRGPPSSRSGSSPRSSATCRTQPPATAAATVPTNANRSQSVSNGCPALELTGASRACGSGRNLGHRVRRPRRVPGRRRPRRARHPLPEGRRGRGAASRRAGAHGPRRRAAAEVQLRDGVPEPRAGGEPPIDRELFVRSDQHTRVPLIPFPPPAGTRTQFDVLHSLEIGEKIKRVRWCARPNRSLCMLATNDRTVKLWKVGIERGMMARRERRARVVMVTLLLQGRSRNTRRRRKGTASRAGARAPRRRCLCRNHALNGQPRNRGARLQILPTKLKRFSLCTLQHS